MSMIDYTQLGDVVTSNPSIENITTCYWNGDYYAGLAHRTDGVSGFIEIKKLIGPTWSSLYTFDTSSSSSMPTYVQLNPSDSGIFFSFQRLTTSYRTHFSSDGVTWTSTAFNYSTTITTDYKPALIVSGVTMYGLDVDKTSFPSCVLTLREYVIGSSWTTIGTVATTTADVLLYDIDIAPDGTVYMLYANNEDGYNLYKYDGSISLVASISSIPNKNVYNTYTTKRKLLLALSSTEIYFAITTLDSSLSLLNINIFRCDGSSIYQIFQSNENYENVQLLNISPYGIVFHCSKNNESAIYDLSGNKISDIATYNVKSLVTSNNTSGLMSNFEDKKIYSIGLYPMSSMITFDNSFDYLYVNPDATGINNGTSWKDSYTTIQPAIDYINNSRGTIIKYIDGSVFGTTGIIPTTGTIQKIAIANNYEYNENLHLVNNIGVDITIEGGFSPSSPLPSSYIFLIPSGTNTILSNSGIGFDNNCSSKIILQNLTLKNYITGIYFNNSDIDLNNVNISGCQNAITIKNSNYSLRNINALNNGISENSIYLYNATGTITNTYVDNYELGLYIYSGYLYNFLNNHCNSGNIGLILDHVTNTGNYRENLFENNNVAIYAEKSPIYGDSNTVYGSGGIVIVNDSAQFFNAGEFNNSIISTLDDYSLVVINSEFLTKNICLHTINKPTGYYLITNEIGTGNYMQSGNILFDNPNFIQPESGDFRLNINSVCLGKGEEIRTSIYKHYPISVESVKLLDYYGIKPFDSYKDNVKIISNSIIYINPISGITDEDLLVKIAEQKTINKDVATICSFEIYSGRPDPYPFDYKIISRFNKTKNSEDYYLIPYTMIELKSLLDDFVDDSDKVLENINKTNLSIKSKYNFNNIVYDDVHGYDSTINEVFYILEKNNQYLIKSDVINGNELNKYYLMRPESSGLHYKSAVYPSGLTRHRELSDGYEFETPYFEKKNKTIDTNYITCLNKEGAIKWLPTHINQDIQSGNIYRDLRGLSLYDGDLYFLSIEQPDNNYSYKRIIKNGEKVRLIKVDLDNEQLIEKIHSGQILDMENPTSITINKENQVVIPNYDRDSSGNYFAKIYKFCYDYAYMDKLQDNTNRIYFREEYKNGVNI